MHKLRTRASAAWKLLVAGAMIASLGAAGSTSAVAETHTTSTLTTSTQATPVNSSSSQWLTGYWHNFNNGSTLLKLTEVPRAYNLVAVAFAESKAGVPGGIDFEFAQQDFGSYYNEAQFRADIKTLQARGQKVIISVGGERAHVSISNATEQANFYSTAKTLIADYGFDGIDIDLEHGINAAYLAPALRSLRADFGGGFVIAMAPQTIDYQAPSFEYFKLTVAIKDILTITNMQFYNSGSMLGEDGRVYSAGTVDFLTALAAKEIEDMGIRPDQVGIGVPAVPSASSSGYVAPSIVAQALDCLETRTNCGSYIPPRAYGKMGGAMTWSINWDATNAYGLSGTLGPRLGSGDGYPDPVDPGDPDPGDPGPGDPDPGDPDPGDPDPGDPDPGPGQGCDGVAPWSSSAVYLGGASVVYDGMIYQAKWWTQGDVPPNNLGDGKPWNRTGFCQDAPDPGNPDPGNPDPGNPDPGNPDPDPDPDPSQGCDGVAPWSSSAVYVGGASVVYNGTIYQAKWWTQGDVPPNNVGDGLPWNPVGSC
ncbi:Chitinase [Micrococcales bacterium KH10]|nr:Chitinase [Micrococcales bacterium KH10]